MHGESAENAATIDADEATIVKPAARLDESGATLGPVERAESFLRDGIRSGRFPAGSRLPSERQLAAELGVSRNTLREAIHALEGDRLLEVRGRSGAYVRVPTLGHVSDALLRYITWTPRAVTIRDLLEVRATIEVDVAGLAAERRTQADLRDIARALADGAANLSPSDDPAAEAAAVEAWSRADVDFHGAVARATHNEVFILIFDALHDVFYEQRRRTSAILPDARIRSFRHHQKILDRIASGDAGGSRKAMRDHLREARDVMIRYAVEMNAAVDSRPASGSEA